MTLKPGTTKLGGKAALPLVLGCGGTACRIKVTAELLIPGRRAAKLPGLSASLPASPPTRTFRIRIPAQRTQIRRLAGRHTAKIRFKLVATGPNGRTVTKTVTTRLRR